MSRLLTAFLDVVDATLSLPLAVLLLLVAAGVCGLLLYFYPRWVPRRWPRIRLRGLRWPRFNWSRLRSWFRRRRKKATTDEDGADEAADEPDEPVEEQVPELPAATFMSLADRLAAEGRFAEAIRERLRGIVRGLVERGIIEHRPGWTVTELAAVAAAARPEVDPPLREATRIFSDIWYGQQPAAQAQDERMRELADALDGRRTAGVAS